MAKGTVIKIKKGYNGIILGEDGHEYRFNRKAIVQGEKEQIVIGRVVEFEPDGEWASQIRLLDEVRKVNASSRAKASGQRKQPAARRRSTHQPAESSGYRFLNPYNFVRFLDKPRPENHVLGNCQPPPHDRYVGLTGRITCRVEAVTPLFISDSHAIQEEIIRDENGRERTHYTYRFFQLDGKPAIPASSLRGMVRSVFEAVTNSCFSTLSGEEMPGDKRLSYHLPPGEALQLVPGRVRRVDDQWMLELLPGATPVVPGQRPSGHQYAAWVQLYRPLQRSKTKAKSPNSPYSRRRRLTRAALQHGKSYWAVIESVQHPLRRFRFWNVVALDESKEQLPEPKPDQLVVKGYLCINNQNIENKHDERLFFRSPDNHSLNRPLPLSDEVRKRYKELITDYQERHKDDVLKRKRKGKDPEQPDGRDPAFSRFIVNKEDRELRDGDLVYAMLERARGEVAVKFLVPVSVPRVSYEHTIGELLGERANERLVCREFERLCPACRVFGWVHPNPEKGGDVIAAYKGRVRFTHAHRVESGEGEPFSVILAILSTPKPTTTRFYLRPQKGKPKDGLPDHKVNYDAPGQILRGRKFYRHHGNQLNKQEYRSVNDQRNDQNRTVRDVQPKGTVFEFTVDFENLAPLELGALLWSLEMDGWHHRLGYAKPLGFGSVIVRVTDLKILDVQERYSSLEKSGWHDKLSEKDEWIDKFKQELGKIYGAPFEDLPNVRDMRALLETSAPLPVHYPRPTEKPHPDGRNYEWFIGNKRSGRNAGPRLVLPLAENDDKGFPFLDRFGNEPEI